MGSDSRGRDSSPPFFSFSNLKTARTPVLNPSPLEQAALDGLEWPRLLAALAGRLQTPMGHAALEGLEFCATPQQAARRLELAARMEELLAVHPLDLHGGKPLEGLLRRAEKEGRLEGEELWRVLTTQRTTAETAARMRGRAGAESLDELAEEAHPLPELVETLARSLTPDGELDDTAYPQLAELKGEIARRRDEIHRKLDGLLARKGLGPAFQERLYTLRGPRYVLPVKADFRGRVAGIVHDISASGSTLFIEPQDVVEPTNQMTLVERQLAQETDRILRELSLRVGKAAPRLLANGQWLGRVDLLRATALLSRAYGGKSPLVGGEGLVHLTGLGHPLMLLEGKQVVRNRLSLGGDARCLVISGANTGGKTVLLKALGLCALLVAAGIPIPAAEGSRLDLFPMVRADIGDQQNLHNSLSTFSAQIQTLAALLEEAGPRSLVLLDEILTGTEPAQGEALAAAVMEALVRRGALCMVTTHYGGLKRLAETSPGFRNGSVEFDLDVLRPTYRVVENLPGLSYAFPIARRHGLPEELVRRAGSLLEAQGAGSEVLLEQTREAEKNLARREAALARSESTLEQKEEAARLAHIRQEERNQTLALREMEVARREKQKVSVELAAARREVTELTRILDRARQLPPDQGPIPAREATREAAGRLRRLEQEASIAEPIQKALEALTPIDWGKARTGTAVYAPSLGQAALLESLPGKREMAKIRLGGLVLEWPAEQLTLPPKGVPLPPLPEKVKPAQKSKRPKPPSTPVEVGLAIQGEQNTLDLRGLTRDEALASLDLFLDAAMLDRVSPVIIIHGFGTGKLMEAVRKTLAASPYVAGVRPGSEEEGGGGVAVAALNL